MGKSRAHGTLNYEQILQLLLALLLSPTLLSCGAQPASDSGVKSGSPTNTPSNTFTEFGSSLEFGKPAVVQYQPNAKKSANLELTVLSAQRGDIADFADFALDDVSKSAQPIYAKVRVRLLSGDMAKIGIPVLGQTVQADLISPAAFSAGFPKCQPNALPTDFSPGKTFTGCVVLMVPAGTRLSSLVFVGKDQAMITWTGKIGN